MRFCIFGLFLFFYNKAVLAQINVEDALSVGQYLYDGATLFQEVDLYDQSNWDFSRMVPDFTDTVDIYSNGDIYTAIGNSFIPMENGKATLEISENSILIKEFKHYNELINDTITLSFGLMLREVFPLKEDLYYSDTVFAETIVNLKNPILSFTKGRLELHIVKQDSVVGEGRVTAIGGEEYYSVLKVSRIIISEQQFAGTSDNRWIRFSDSKRFSTRFIWYAEGVGCPVVIIEKVDKEAPVIKSFQTKFALGINDINQEKLVVFPNPASRNIQLMVDKGFINNPVSIRSIVGEIVWEGIINEEREWLDIGFLNPGVYLISINKKDLVLHRKVVVE